jgi:hypothetical protein
MTLGPNLDVRGAASGSYRFGVYPNMNCVFLLVAASWAANQPETQPLRINDEARMLSRRSVSEIVRLATSGGNGVWLLVGDTSQTLPEKRFIDAYLEPDTSGAVLRRGRVVSLESRIVKGTAVRWTVTSPVRQYAQVSRQPNRWPVSLEDLSIERPFVVDGDFAEEELIGLVSFVRASPKPDGLLGLNGTLPITEVRRSDSVLTVVLQGSTRHGQTADLSRIAGRWKLLRVTMWIM